MQKYFDCGQVQEVEIMHFWNDDSNAKSISMCTKPKLGKVSRKNLEKMGAVSLQEKVQQAADAGEDPVGAYIELGSVWGIEI